MTTSRCVATVPSGSGLGDRHAPGGACEPPGTDSRRVSHAHSRTNWRATPSRSRASAGLHADRGAGRARDRRARHARRDRGRDAGRAQRHVPARQDTRALDRDEPDDRAPTAGAAAGRRPSRKAIVDYAGQRWHWTVKVTQTQVETMRRMDVTVRAADAPEGSSLASVTGFYGTAIGPAGGGVVAVGRLGGAPEHGGDWPGRLTAADNGDLAPNGRRERRRP